MKAISLPTLTGAVWLCAAGVLPAQAPAPAPRDAASLEPDASLPQPIAETASAPLSAADVSAFVDGMLPASMAIGDIAGSVVVVVKDGEVLFAKGYGFADVKKRTPVTPATMFRPGSISKLFGWTAVMQQVEAGRLDLDHDINEYLDFRIEGYGGQPIKLRHLMTHTAGFEERLRDLLLDDPRKMKPLGVMLKASIPARIYPPGSVPAYSNYGATLAGYIVERVSGVPFEAYVEQRIFGPLGMRHSTFRQPVPAALLPQLSNSYKEASGEPVPFEYCPDVPAGALSASSLDMARFMNAHLYDGAPPDLGEPGRILSPQTTQLMHAPANSPAPSIDAMALGFYEQNRNGYRTIAHGGDLTAFHSDLILIPQAHVGIYMSFNSVGKGNATYPLRTALYEGFMDRYFPRREPFPKAETPADTVEHGRKVSGTYELSRLSAKNLFSVMYLPGQVEASVDEKGVLQVGSLTNLNEQPKKFREIAPWLWREIDGEMRLQAMRSPTGEIVSLVPDGFGPIFVLRPVPAWRSKGWLMPALGISTGIVVVSALAGLICAVRGRRRHSGGVAHATPAHRLVKQLTRWGWLSALAFVVLICFIVSSALGGSFWVFSSSATWLLRLVQLSALLVVFGAVAAVVAAVRSWRLPGEKKRRSFGRTLIAAACLVFAYLALAFHFLTPHLVY